MQTTYTYTINDRDLPPQSAFITDIIRNNKKIGHLLGFQTKNNTILNVLFLREEIASNEIKINIVDLAKKHLGDITVLNNQVAIIQIAPIQPADLIFNQERSWVTCLRDCVGNAHIACNSDPECTTLLIVSNIAGNWATPSIGGIGSISIATACGIVCAKNTNLDLLPQY